MCFIVVFAQIAVAIGVLTSSLGVRDREISRIVAGGVSSRVSLKVSYGVLVAVLDRGTGWEVWSRVSAWVSLVVFDRECGRKGVAEGVTWGVPDVGCPGVVGSPCGWEVSRRVLCGVSLVVFDRGFGFLVGCEIGCC